MSRPIDATRLAEKLAAGIADLDADRPADDEVGRIYRQAFTSGLRMALQFVHAAPAVIEAAE